jgi:gliding motility-associated-like protein
MAKYFIYLLIFFIASLSSAQVVAEGDTVLCDGQQGQVELTLSATSFAVDLTDSNIASDDIFGGVIDMGFNFSFYGNTYNQVVLSSNNYLSFNVANGNGYSGWAIGNAIPNNIEAPMNAILCPWQDINPGLGNGVIQYATTGETPNRVFIASFCGIPMFNCTDICYSSQIKLYETSNIIETHIAEKVLCVAWNAGAAIHGLHNDNGSIAHVVTGLDGIERNYPNQWTCENDAWRFTPNGANDYVLEDIEFAPAVAGTDIIWQDEFGNNVGTGGEIIVIPGGNVTYTAGASLCGNAGDWCGFEGGIEGDDVSITFESVNISDIEVENVSCAIGSSDGSITTNVIGTNPLSYTWYNSDGDIIFENNNNLNNITSGTYTLVVSTDNGCEDSVEVFVDIDGVPVTQSDAGEDIEICETEIILSANAPIDGEIGYWSLVSGEGNIIDSASSTTSAINLGVGENIFSWTLENECGNSLDQVEIIVLNSDPVIVLPNEIYCLDNITLSVNVNSGSGEWTVLPTNGVYIDDVSNLNTYAIVPDYGSYTFSFEGCNGIDDQTIIMESLAPVITGPTEAYCLDEFQLSVTVAGDFGSWECIGPGNVDFNNTSSTNPVISVDSYGVYEFIYEGCGDSSSYFVEMISPDPYIEDPGVIYCTLSAELNAVSSLSGTWSLTEESSINANIDGDGSSAYITVGEYGIYNVIYTSCGVSDTLLLSFQTIEPYIFSADHVNCMFLIELNVMTPDPNAGPWEQLSGPSVAEITNPYSNSTQAIVSEFGVYTFAFTSCELTNTIEIGVSCPLNVPNSFSPNGDGVNDLFQIAELDPNVYTQSTLYVFNKWGAVVYINPNYGIDGDWWDGKTTYSERTFSSLLPARYYDNSSGYVTDGVYFYTLEVYNTAQNEKEFYSGDIAIFSDKK